MMNDIPMKKCFIQNRDELYILQLDTLAYLQAEGNYTRITYIGGLQLMITMGISKVEESIREAAAGDSSCQFLRLGRSLVVNRSLIHYINVTAQKLTLFDGEKCYLTLPVSKSHLRSLKAEFCN